MRSLTYLIICLCWMTSSMSAQSLSPCRLEGDIVSFITEEPVKHERNLKKFDRFKQIHAQVQKRIAENPCPTGIAIIPIAFHIFHEGEEEGQGYNYSRGDLVEVVNQLNEDFNGYDVNRRFIARMFDKVDAGHTCIQFAIGKINRIDRRTCPQAISGANHDQLYVCLPGGAGIGSKNDPNDYLNLYSHDLSNGFLGIASCIPNLFGMCNTSADGVTIHRDILIPNRSSLEANRHGGVLAHEIGHWLGLPHVNGDIRGGGCDGDDGFEDTFPQENQQFMVCHSLRIPSSCKTPDNVYNFMDYGADCVKLMFTAQQAAMMNAVLMNNRTSLLGSYKRGNIDQQSLKNNSRNSQDSMLKSSRFSIINAECHTSINLLEYMREWYPTNNGAQVNGGATLYYWTTNNGNQIEKISGIDLAEYSLSHRDRFSSEITVLKLRQMLWDPIRLRYGEETDAGTLLVVLTDCGVPANDSLQGSLLLTAQDCGQRKFYIHKATPSNMSDLLCSNDPTKKDVWFTVVVPQNGAIELEAYRLEDGFAPPRMQLFTRSGLSEKLSCIDSRPINFIRRYDLTPNDTIFIRVVNANDDVDKGVFAICVTEPPLRNDDCITSVILDVTKDVRMKEYTNEGARISNTPSFYFGCGDGGIQPDVWFVLRVPVEGRVTIETAQVENGLTGTVLEAFVGDCSQLTAIGCSDNKSYWPIYDDFSRLSLYNLTPQSVIYVRVGASGSVLQGRFNLSAYLQDENATICGITNIVLGETYACEGSSNTFDQELFVHYNSPDAQTVLWVNDDIYNIETNPQRIVLEDLLSNGQWVDIVANLSNDENSECWQQSFHFVRNAFLSPEPCLSDALINDECEGAIFIMPSDDIQLDTFTNIGATWSETHSTQFDCGNSGSRPEDVWFKTVIPLTGGVDISLPLLYNENNMILEVYLGDCDDMTLLGCDQFSQVWGSFIRLTDQRPGDTIYIRVADQGSNTQDIFLIVVSEYTAARATYLQSWARSSRGHADENLSLHEEVLSVHSSPNPVSDNLHIQNKSQYKLLGEFYNSSGQVQLTTSVEAFSHERVSVADWISGLYVVRWYSANGLYSTEKIVVKH